MKVIVYHPSNVDTFPFKLMQLLESMREEISVFVFVCVCVCGWVSE